MNQALDIDSRRAAVYAPLEARLAFLRKTYVTLLGAVGAFAALSAVLVQSGFGEAMLTMLGGRWLIVLGGLMLVSWIAHTLASPERTGAIQLAGLALYVVGQAVIFSPIFFIVTTYPEYDGVLGGAAAVTGLLFGGLSFYVLTTKKDFSFLRGALVLLSFLALALIVAAAIFGLNLGMWFSIAMIALACGYILYDTSKVLHTYGTGQHVGAALALFSSLTILLWYVLRLFMQSRR